MENFKELKLESEFESEEHSSQIFSDGRESLPYEKEINEQEKKYRVFSNMRFEEGISELIINEFVDRYSRVPNERTDDLCSLEHISCSSTATITNKPLTPFSLLTGARSLDEMARGRKRSAILRGSFNYNSITRQANPASEDGRYEIEIDGTVKDEFFDLLKNGVLNNPEQIEGDNEVFCIFNDTEFDSKTGKIIFPNINKIGAMHLLVPADIAKHIRLKQIWYAEGEGYCQYIDQDGWRFDKK